MTTNHVIIDGQAYSPKHPKALALQRPTGPQPGAPEPAPSMQQGLRVAKRIRQSAGPKLNKLEAAWLAEMRSDSFIEHIGIQALKFSIGNGCTYCPDFSCWLIREERIRCYEVKGGFIREDSIVKLKVAARAFPYIEWFLVWRDKGKWQLQEIFA